MKQSPFTAFTMLVLFANRKVTLTSYDFDLYWDRVVQLLEEVNNEKYRLQEDATPTTIYPEE